MSFGWSAGDIVTAVKLLYQVGTVLKDAGGASSDFQDHISFLETLGRTLQHLNGLQSLPLDPEVTRNLLEQCKHVQGPLQSFLDDIKSSFEPALSTTSKRDKFCAAPRKIQWALLASKNIKRLQDRIATPMAGISLILGQQVILTTLRMPSNIQTQIAHTMDTALNSGLRNFKQSATSELNAISVSQTEITKAVVQQTLDCATQSSSLHYKLDQVDMTIKAIENSLQKNPMSKNISKPEVYQSEIKRATFNITKSIWLLLSSLQLLIRELVLLIAPYIFKFYKDTIHPLMCIGDQFLFEDGIGRVRKLSCAQFQHWNLFYDLLKDSFKDAPGQSLVLSDRFVLLNGYSDYPISKQAWRAAIQPKSKVKMAMVLKATKARLGGCPNPLCPGRASFNSAKTSQICLNCGKHLLFLTDYPKSRGILSLELASTDPLPIALADLWREDPSGTYHMASFDEKEIASFKRVLYEKEEPSSHNSNHDSYVPKQQITNNRELVTETLKEQQPGKQNKNYAKAKGPSLHGWYTCCQCTREINMNLWGVTCPDCPHSKCESCNHLG